MPMHVKLVKALNDGNVTDVAKILQSGIEAPKKWGFIPQGHEPLGLFEPDNQKQNIFHKLAQNPKFSPVIGILISTLNEISNRESSTLGTVVDSILGNAFGKTSTTPAALAAQAPDSSGNKPYQLALKVCQYDAAIELASFSSIQDDLQIAYFAGEANRDPANALIELARYDNKQVKACLPVVLPHLTSDSLNNALSSNNRYKFKINDIAVDVMDELTGKNKDNYPNNVDLFKSFFRNYCYTLFIAKFNSHSPEVNEITAHLVIKYVSRRSAEPAETAECTKFLDNIADVYLNGTLPDEASKWIREQQTPLQSRATSTVSNISAPTATASALAETPQKLEGGGLPRAGSPLNTHTAEDSKGQKLTEPDTSSLSPMRSRDPSAYSSPLPRGGEKAEEIESGTILSFRQKIFEKIREDTPLNTLITEQLGSKCTMLEVLIFLKAFPTTKQWIEDAISNVTEKRMNCNQFIARYVPLIADKELLTHNSKTNYSPYEYACATQNVEAAKALYKQGNILGIYDARGDANVWQAPIEMHCSEMTNYLVQSCVSQSVVVPWNTVMHLAIKYADLHTVELYTKIEGESAEVHVTKGGNPTTYSLLEYLLRSLNELYSTEKQDLDQKQRSAAKAEVLWNMLDTLNEFCKLRVDLGSIESVGNYAGKLLRKANKLKGDLEKHVSELRSILTSLYSEVKEAQELLKQWDTVMEDAESTASDYTHYSALSQIGRPVKGTHLSGETQNNEESQ
jgi:hypothetical protein